MTIAEVVQLLGGVLFGLAIWSVAAERRMVRRMRIFDATHPANAVSLAAKTPVARFRLWRLVRAGAVIEARPGTHYINQTRYAQYREERRKRAIVLMLFVLASLLLLSRVL